jgi:outer membrane protein OmpA-like peptidoglycan-associated protein
MTMIFTRRIGGFEDLYVAGWDSIGKQWIGALPIQAINTAQNEGAHTISANGRVLVFTSCNRRDGVGSCDLYLTFKRSDGNWSEVRNLRSINSRGWDGQPALTADGRGLYFSSDRAGGEGNRDIWFTRITDSGWTEPENLGPIINTPQNESSPFVHRDDRTLYFMSDGHPGMGDYDLFVSRKETGEWTMPKNLGYPINTPGREGALTVHPNGLTAYYTKESGDLGTMDIYQFELPEDAVPDPVSYLDVIVKDATNGQPVVAVAWIYALTDTTRRDRYVSDGGGRISAGLPHGRKYGMHITAPGYLFFSTQFDLDRTEPYKRISIEVGIQPVVQAGQESSPVVLRNVEFESGSAELLESSASELRLLLELLRSDPEVRMEIRGHTDNIGDPQSNLTLSKQRAESVYNWLIEAGVDPQRLTYEGFGETMPLDSNETAEGRQRNRRTEFKLLR